MSRTLLSVIRRVPGDAVFSYDQTWARLRNAVSGKGAHAWRFRSAADGSVYIEFIEFGDADPRLDPGFTETFSALESISQGMKEEWVEATGTSDDEER